MCANRNLEKTAAMSLTFRSSDLAQVIARPQEFLHPSGATTTITSVGAFLPLSVIRELASAPVSQRTEFLNALVVNVTDPEHSATEDLDRQIEVGRAVAGDFVETLAALAK